MKYAAYDEYKPAGIEWLGNVPAHWTIARSDGIVSSERRQVQPEVFLSEDVFHYSIPLVQEHGTGAVEEGESIKSAKQPVFRKSLLVSKLNPRKATIVVAEPQPDLRTLCSTEFVTLFADKCDLGFLTYVTLSEAFRQRLDAAVQSVTRSHQRANPRDIYSFWNAWPPLGEQQTIAHFLDAKTAQIDALVAHKRQLIDKLKEKRSALIARTVTRGLPPEAAKAAGLEPNPEMKASGVEWLGETPSHWATPPLYARYSVELGKMLSEAKITGEHLIPYLRNVDVQWNVINYQDLPEMDIPSAEYPRYTIRTGDLLVCEGGEVGRASIVGEFDGEIGYQKALHRLRALRDDEDQHFMCFILEWVAQTGVFNAGGTSTIAHLTGEQLRKYRFPKPPKNEQQLIVQYLQREADKISHLRDEVEAAISRLTEYRQALITSAVTGKIDVRGLA